MMIKSLACKAQTPFNYLIDYFHKQDIARGAFSHNLLSRSPEAVKAEMNANIKYLSKREGCNQAYHEMLSLPKELKIPRKRQAAMLEDIARFYLSRRAPKCLAYGVIHYDQEHLHMHIAITANEIRDRKRHSLSKAAFRQIQQDVEAYRIREYPELGRDTYYDDAARARKSEREKYGPVLKDREKAMKVRTGKLSRKERDHFLVRDIFQDVKSERQLVGRLKQAGFELYIRGKSEGVIAADGRRYRLRTIGLEERMLTARARIKLYEDRMQAVEQIHPDPPENNRERS